MTLEDIQQALRLTAMGRVGHPLQVELAEGLEKLLETPEERGLREWEQRGSMGDVMAMLDSLPDGIEPASTPLMDKLQAVAVAPVPADAPKKRAKKAD